MKTGSKTGVSRPGTSRAWRCCCSAIIGMPGPLRGLPTHHAAGRADSDAIDGAIGRYRRLVVVGADADLAAVLTRLLRADRLDVEVAYRAAPAHPGDPDIPAANRTPGGTARPARFRPAGDPDPRRDRVGDRRPGRLAAGR